MIMVVVIIMILIIQSKFLCGAHGCNTAVICGFFRHISNGFIWRIRRGIGHFLCTDSSVSVRIEMEEPVSRCRDKLEKMERFVTGDALRR
jgi:hypothetical protein